MHSIRAEALSALLKTDVNSKLAATLGINGKSGLELSSLLQANSGRLPCSPAKPILVHPSEVKQRSVHTKEGRAILIHALAHIEFNAVNLALDITWRFDNLPNQFYLDWVKVAKEEAHHFRLLRNHLNGLGFEYGDFPAHNGLWEMAEKTKDDVLARLALVPRTMEARGLDVSPGIRDKLRSVGDIEGAAILEIILHDEIGHVTIGNHWYHRICAERKLDPTKTNTELALQYGAPSPRAPFNVEARRQAGFTDDELTMMGAS
ncbi:ferritin-like domain-containing protein [Ottowia sp.]|uniref:ferritin-like domain-containing protein n=1 Tax=Ottowia sp. TaxID=1898956 RepID=UPI002CB9C7FC|nr:ferritin-like domain-containing protein [Ottowia sp.]HPZ57492.1 ferritin-like domain-containing protein [Ottowia sp.]HQD48144.1 ferritin-like domain-containing protein [Ottowia sp.]